MENLEKSYIQIHLAPTEIYVSEYMESSRRVLVLKRIGVAILQNRFHRDLRGLVRVRHA